MTKGGVRGAVDNNNYYTRRSFANAVLRGWLATRGGKKGSSVDGVGAGNGPLSCPVTSGGSRGRVSAETREGGGRRVILKRDRYASLSRALFLLSMCSLYDCLVSLSLPISCSSLIPHPCPLYTWSFVSPLRPTNAPLSHPFAAQWTYSKWTTL